MKLIKKAVQMNNINKIRKSVKMTQNELAKKVGVTQSAIAAWETGKANPQFSRLEKIAQALNCEVKDLIETENPA